jgi:hypothetical protein
MNATRLQLQVLLVTAMASISNSRSRWHEMMKSRFEESENKVHTLLLKCATFHLLLRFLIKPDDSHSNEGSDGIDGIPLQGSHSQSLVPYATEELVSIHTRLNNRNKGFQMLSRLGWQEGQPLGVSPDG